MNVLAQPIVSSDPQSDPAVRKSWHVVVLETFKANAVTTLVHVPDQVVAPLIRLAEADDTFQVYSPAKEEEGIGIVCGAHLGGRRGVMVMQNSGAGNIVNVLASLVLPAQIPLLMLISQRGELNEFNPSQTGMAQVLRPMLDALGIPHFTLSRLDEVQPTVDGACRLAFQTDRPLALILSPLLTGGKKG